MLQSSVARTQDYEKRERLVAQAAEVLARTGIVDTSLRTLATELGTSARMLVYYFGSKEALILAVLERQRRLHVPEVETFTTTEELRRWCFDDWRSITRGEHLSRVRILQQVFGAACGNDSPYTHYTAEILEKLRRNAQSRMEAVGMPNAVAQTRARVAVAAIQGLLIDYFTTTEHARVDDTFRRLIDDVMLAPFEPVDAAQRRTGVRFRHSR